MWYNNGVPCCKFYFAFRPSSSCSVGQPFTNSKAGISISIEDTDETGGNTVQLDRYIVMRMWLRFSKQNAIEFNTDTYCVSDIYVLYP
jgi:hypothetical protein